MWISMKIGDNLTYFSSIESRELRSSFEPIELRMEIM